jgi:hypothetical protein
LCNFRSERLLQSPCTRSIVACRYEVEDPYEYFIDQYIIQYYKNTYKHFLIPINIENLASDSGILPPVFKKQRGRPKTKRIRKGAWKKKATLCSNCQGTGHNRRTCRFAPAHSRRQRARDHDSDVESTAVGSTVDSDDERHQAEMAEIDRATQFAWEIVERNRQLFEGLNSDSDSELSMPESSQVESMEGIEVTGAGGTAGIDGSSEDRGGSSEVRGGSEAKVTRYGRKVKQATFRLWEAQ